MAYKYLRTQNGTILLYHTDDTIGPGSSHAMLLSASYADWESNTGVSSRIYNLDNGAYIEAIRNIDLSGNVSLTGRLYNSAGDRLLDYSQGLTAGGFEQRGVYALCMQWRDDGAGNVYIGFGYYTYATYNGTGNTAFAPGAWISIDSTREIYNHPMPIGGGSSVGPNVYGNAVVNQEVPDNPYSPGGTSEPGGGVEGDYTLVHDIISIPEKPQLSALSTGFVSIWTPDETQIRDLARFMWNADLLTIDFWRKLVADPIDLIYSLAIFPCDIVPDGNDIVCVGLTSTGVRMDYYNSQYFDVDCGSVMMSKYWDAYLDYNPYTKVNIYLPYIGVKPLNVDEVMGDRIAVKYRIDLASGVCVAFIRCGDSVLYQFSGNCATQIPVTSLQFADLVRSAVSLGTAVGATLATAGAAGPAAISAAASLAMSKPDVAHSGAIGNAAGLMAVQRPYLIVTRPRQALPEDQEVYTGFPSFITQEFTELEGYTEVDSVHLHNIPATQSEVDEINRLLHEGVIF